MTAMLPCQAQPAFVPASPMEQGSPSGTAADRAATVNKAVFCDTAHATNDDSALPGDDIDGHPASSRPPTVKADAASSVHLPAVTGVSGRETVHHLHVCEPSLAVPVSAADLAHALAAVNAAAGCCP